MRKYILILGAASMLGACSWVDSTGSQSNVVPAIQNDTGAALLEEGDVYEQIITDDGDLETSFVIIDQGPSAVAKCAEYLGDKDETAGTLSDACSLRIDPEDCQIEFQASTGNNYTAKIPELRQSFALKYLVTTEDINGETDEDELTLCLKAINDAPIAESHTYQVEYLQTRETSDAVFDEFCRVISGSGVLSGASDDFDYATAPMQGEPCLSVSIETAPEHAAAFTLNPLGGFTYRANANRAPDTSDSFKYVISDGDKSSIATTVTIDVVGDNEPPEVLAIPTLLVDENSSGSIAVTELARDPEGEELKIFSITAPENGTTTQSIDGSELSYTPDDDYSGNDSFGFVVQDIAGATAQGQVNVFVARSNKAPTIAAPATQNYNFNDAPSSPVTFIVTVGDRETDEPLLQLSATSSRNNIASVSAPQAISGDGTALISVNANANGTTTLTLTVTDRGLQEPVQRPAKSATTTVFITIRGVNNNHAPTANNGNRDVEEGRSLSINLEDFSNDQDGDLLHFRLNNPPTGVTLTGSTLNIGSAATQTLRTFSVSFVVDDGDKTASGTVSITVTKKPNAAPIALNATQSIQAGASASFNLATLTSDADGDTRSYSLINAPAEATLSSTTVTVRSNATDSNRDISVQYQVSDGEATARATLTVQVSALPNNAPIARDATQSIQAGASASFNLATLTSDADGDTRSYSLINAPTGASLSGTTVTVRSNATDSNRDISVQYEVSDGEATARATLTVRVSALPNNAPTITDSNASVTAGQTATINLSTLANDVDGDPLSYSLDTTRAGTSLIGSTLRVNTTTADAGSTIFVTYRVSDSEDFDTGVLSVTVAALPNNPPTIGNSSANITAGDAASVDLSTLSNDADGDSLSYSLITTPAGASLSGSLLTLTTAAETSSGNIVVTYRVSDGEATADGQFTVTVVAQNQAPTTRDVERSIDAGQSTTLDLAIISADADGDSLSYSLSNQTAGATLNGSVISFSSVASAPTQTVNIGFAVTDGQATTLGTLSVIVTALPTNNAPVATNGSISVTLGDSASIDLAGMVSDADGDSLSFSLNNPPTQASLSGSILSYAAALGDTIGPAEVTYTVTDGTANASATVAITVEAAVGG